MEEKTSDHLRKHHVRQSEEKMHYIETRAIKESETGGICGFHGVTVYARRRKSKQT